MDATTPPYSEKRFNEIKDNCSEFLKKDSMKLKITVQSSLKKLVTKSRKRFNSSQSQDGTEIT